MRSMLIALPLLCSFGCTPPQQAVNVQSEAPTTKKTETPPVTMPPGAERVKLFSDGSHLAVEDQINRWMEVGQPEILSVTLSVAPQSPHSASVAYAVLVRYKVAAPK